MNRSFKAIANRIVFANRKNRVVIRKAKTNDHAALHAYAVHALYCLYGSLRGVLGASTQTRTGTTARLTDCCTAMWQSGMQPCPVVRRRSPAVVVVA
ncbi:MAG TPA: hypothetical protein VGJ04_00075 [Pirellulales bacterium]